MSSAEQEKEPASPWTLVLEQMVPFLHLAAVVIRNLIAIIPWETFGFADDPKQPVSQYAQMG